MSRIYSWPFVGRHFLRREFCQGRKELWGLRLRRPPVRPSVHPSVFQSQIFQTAERFFASASSYHMQVNSGNLPWVHATTSHPSDWTLLYKHVSFRNRQFRGKENKVSSSEVTWNAAQFWDLCVFLALSQHFFFSFWSLVFGIYSLSVTQLFSRIHVKSPSSAKAVMLKLKIVMQQLNEATEMTYCQSVPYLKKKKIRLFIVISNAKL